MGARDINGQRIVKGTKVRRAAWGSDVIPKERRGKFELAVRVVGKRGTPLDGFVSVENLDAAGVTFRAWESGKNFERPTPQ
jgi:hypothetical protein